MNAGGPFYLEFRNNINGYRDYTFVFYNHYHVKTLS